jgi:NMD protein affecting ribosome stability and mRNA decay
MGVVPSAFTCPDCGRESWNENDGIHGYCGACHAFTGNPMRPRIIIVPCRRCSKPLGTLTKSLWGADAARRLYGAICDSCLTPEERAKMNRMVDQAVLKRT